MERGTGRMGGNSMLFLGIFITLIFGWLIISIGVVIP
jgi:hypothetical protein